MSEPIGNTEEMTVSEWIPANPEINSKALHDREMANQELSVRDRQVKPVFIPAPLEDEQVPVPLPTKRRHFEDPNAVGGARTRRTD
jgi:hypothetical protein